MTTALWMAVFTRIKYFVFVKKKTFGFGKPFCLFILFWFFVFCFLFLNLFTFKMQAIVYKHCLAGGLIFG